MQLAPPVLVEEAAKLAEHAREREDALSDGYDLTLIGRRQLRSNNSWMHNSARLMKGADRCTALLHPDDAGARGLDDGDQRARRLARRRDRAAARGQRRDPPRRGLGPARLRARARRASAGGWPRAKAGASVNDITDPSVVDALTGNAAFNAVPVRVEAA